jgi:hypothetical protein
MEALSAEAQEWISWDPNPSTKAAVEASLAQALTDGSTEPLQVRYSMRLQCASPRHIARDR